MRAYTCLLLLLGSALGGWGGSVDYSLPIVTWGPEPINPAAVSLINATLYNSSLPAADYSWPVVKLAGVITLNGADSTYGMLLQQVYSFMVDLINLKGGVKVNGTDHHISLTWATDDSSSAFLLYLYSLWLDDPSYSIFMTPSQDQQVQLLSPVMVASGSTFFDILASDPANFAQHYPYLWTLIISRDQSAVYAMNNINSRAVQYHQDLTTGVVQPTVMGEASSSFGILSMCLYTHNDPAQIQTCQGVRTWVNATNAQRKTAGAGQRDLITIIVDLFWPLTATSSDADLYTTSFNECPDNVDVMVVCGEMTKTDADSVAAALYNSRLRPKAAYSTSAMPGYNPTNATMQNNWAGWLTIGTNLVPPANLPGPPTFTTVPEMQAHWSLYYNSSTVTNLQTFYPAGFEIIKAALASTASLSSEDLRSAFLSLHGNNYIRPVKMDNLTGVNDASINPVMQLTGSGTTLIVNVSKIVYPYPWPWSRIQVGDRVNVQQSSSDLVLSVVLAVLGCWVALIVLEQAVYVRRRGGWYQLWLLPVTVTLGGAGIWSSQLTMASALSWFIPGLSASLPVSYSLNIIILAVLPCMVLTFAALVAAVQDVDINSGTSASKLTGVTASLQEQKDRKQKLAALSFTEHCVYLRGAMSRYVLLAGTLLLSAVFATRVTLSYVWCVQAIFVNSVAAWITSAVVCLPLVILSVLMYVHALRWRVVTVFILAISVFADWQIQVALGTFAYAEQTLNVQSSLSTTSISSTSILLIAGIVAALSCFGFVGLQFSRMKLSRTELMLLLVHREHFIEKLQAEGERQEKVLATERWRRDHLVRLMECITLLGSSPKDYTFVLASHTPFSVFLDAHDVKGLPVPETSYLKRKVVRSLTARSSASASQVHPLPSSNDALIVQPMRGANPPSMEPDAKTARSLSSRETSTAAENLSSTRVSWQQLRGGDAIQRCRYEKAVLAMIRQRESLEPSSQAEEKRPGGRLGAMPWTGSAPLPIPSLRELLRHPVCIELLKAELLHIHSEENIGFYLHAIRYRKLVSGKLRKALARMIFDTYIAEGSEQQINISTQQRDQIESGIRKRDSVASAADLFDHAEREVLSLMETNLGRGFVGSARHAACVWVYSQLKLTSLLETSSEENGFRGEESQIGGASMISMEEGEEPDEGIAQSPLSPK